MIEKEYKTMLNYEKYIRLLEVFHFEEALVQVNLYYISKQDDNNTVRVRCKSGRIFLQVKIDCSIEKGKDELHLLAITSQFKQVCRKNT